MSDITDELLDYKEQIEEAETKKTKAEGALEETKNRMKKDYKLTSLNHAKKELEELNKKINEKTTKLNEGLEELRNIEELE